MISAISDNYELLQHKLDVNSKSRSSRLPWRGQFSPEFVEYILDTSLLSARNIYDPFCGSGTVLFESAMKGRMAQGSEVNPAAWQLSSLIGLSGLDSQEIFSFRSQALRAFNLLQESDFAQQEIANLLKERKLSDELKTILACSFLLGMKNSSEPNLLKLQKGLDQVISLLIEMSAYPGRGACFFEDSRSSSIETGSVDGVITSPPYINVFNYHQNYRPAAELLGWHPLDAAKAEIGANRKHRQNRFLTVTQYCLDMALVIDELSRVCKEGALSVVVVGRESTVLGTAFCNSAIVKELFGNNPGFELRSEAERVFTNRFGQSIYEDILIFRSIGRAVCSNGRAHRVAIDALKQSKANAPASAMSLIDEAIYSAHKIFPSPNAQLLMPY